MKRQWRKFLRRAKKQGLYRSAYSPFVVPWLLRYLHKSIKAKCKADIEDIAATLRDKHSIGLSPTNDLYFLPLNEAIDRTASNEATDRTASQAVER